MSAVAEVDRLLGEIGDRPENLIALLQGIQETYRYLPDEALRHLALRTSITAAEIEGVASFYAQFRRKPVGRHLVKVCHGTACHVKGAGVVEDSLRRHLRMDADEDTTADGLVTLEQVACVGCCSLAPVVVVEGETLSHLDSSTAPGALDESLSRLARPRAKRIGRTRPSGSSSAELRIATDSCCAACGAVEVRDALLQAAADRAGAVKTVSCTGLCHLMPMVETDRGERYTRVRPEDAEKIVRRHLAPQSLGGFLRSIGSSVLDRLSEPLPPPVAPADPRDPVLCEFLGPQMRLAMEDGGRSSPFALDGYLASGGFEALEKARANPEKVVGWIKEAGLRGRGGAGFPTWRKWEAVADAPGRPKYLILNGDEGDPGAFMDRMLLESFPFRVLEGMAIAACAMGIEEGVLYVRAEYPQAVAGIRKAISMLEERGLLGSLALRVVQGAGAFVCGEETALIASVEGQRGTPRLKPPYPSEQGLWGCPTCVNNVETYALVPWIVRHGPQAFAQIGMERSKGTKVFALAGSVRRGGLIEVPMGTTLRQIVDEVGGGVEGGFKAVLVGGPSGGCVPASLADTPVDYESLQAAGAIMGSGGLVVLDNRSCVVDVARYFMGFTQTESCGKCTLCRIGTRRMLEILNRLCEGEGKAGDLDELESLAESVAAGSICGLGQTAPNPVLSTLRHFRSEYEAHLEGRCPSGRCTKLIRYRVTDACIGCTLCAQACPVDAIPMTPLVVHSIDDALCVRCDVCRSACPEEAIVVE
ncbi:MAG TPA: NAD(P)H-dependent oxidoreductase subunit E [Fimbriimonas sp.]